MAADEAKAARHAELDAAIARLSQPLKARIHQHVRELDRLEEMKRDSRVKRSDCAQLYQQLDMDECQIAKAIEAEVHELHRPQREADEALAYSEQFQPSMRELDTGWSAPRDRRYQLLREYRLAEVRRAWTAFRMVGSDPVESAKARSAVEDVLGVELNVLFERGVSVLPARLNPASTCAGHAQCAARCGGCCSR